MDILNQIEYIVGIGTTYSGVSIARVNDPLNVIIVSSWNDCNNSPQKFLSSILYLKNENDAPLCGIERDDVGDLGVYVANIGQYLFDIDASNEKLGHLMDGLTIKKVIADYLKYFVQLALKRLQVHDKVLKNNYFEAFFNEEFIDEDIKTICYCLVCPTDRQKFMKDCFVEAGIIEESEAEYRLLFTTKAVATAHCQLSLERGVTRIQNNQSYLVCDVDDISIGIAKMHAAYTESFSSVTTISDNLAYGSMNLETKFEDTDFPEEVAITQNDANGNLIQFTYEKLNRIVFKEFIEGVIEYISNAFEAHRPCKLLISGKYGADTHFFENLTKKCEGEIKQCIYPAKSSLDMISSGAVSSILISPVSSQIPYFDGEQVSRSKKILENPAKNVNRNDTYDFIVGIDFGATFSGCSYAQLKDKHGKPIDTKTIKTIIDKWPGSRLNVFGKTPTLLTYDKKMKPKYFGEEARIQAKLHKELNLLENFKLFLCPESLENFYGHTNDLEELKEQGGFTEDKDWKTEVHAVKVIADYLKLFKNHIIEHIVTKEMDEKFTFHNRSKLLKKYKMRYAITVPAMWNSSARDTMAQAAVEATIIKKDEVDQLLIISEPEAAALHCEKRFTNYFNSLEGNINDTNFIVCDAGGGTVDLVTFNLQINEKKRIDDLSNWFGVNIDKENVPLDDLMRDFVTNYKPNFMPNLQGDINLPGKGITNFTVDSTYRMANGNKTLKMKNQEMKEEIFDPIVNRIFALIDDQFKHAKRFGIKIDALLMIGGFSQSKYLQQRIRNQYSCVCPVSVPFEGVTAISHGAVSYALNPPILTKKNAGQSLSLNFQEPFDKNLNNSAKKVKGSNGDRDFKKELLQYYVGRGQKLKYERTLYKENVYVLYPNAAVIAIFSCDSEEDADNKYITTRHTKIVETKIIMPSMVGIDGRIIHFTVTLQIECMGLSVTVECQDQLINAEVQNITRNRCSSLIFETMRSINVAGTKQPLLLYSLRNN
ncbi:hypothetical protein INT47_003040 [Mucor saturninus]|uniref:Heat shock protein 70 n=1 Tax=Mucor saturninus TaxID=64648 RepID=A0A8H7QTX3_9FUNG|nr:hypothetical protein INT47_003040 [Mucor saturninus]